MTRDSKGRFIKGHNTPVPESVRLKISKTCKERGIGKWMKGRKLPEETRRKQSVNSSRYWTGKTGEEHPHWKKVKANPLYLTVRQCFEYREWRKRVYERDNYACVLCGRKEEVSGKLEADHYPKQFIHILREHKIDSLESAKNCSELWDDSNGRTLCKECHNPTRGFR